MTAGNFTALMVIALLSGFGAAMFGKHTGKELMRHEAITAGVAHRIIADPVTGRTEFQWKTNCVEAE